MTIYYYETKHGCGQAQFESDEQAILAWRGIPCLLVIYVETDNNDMRIVWEKL